MEDVLATLAYLKMPGVLALGAMLKWIYDKKVSKSQSNWKDAKELRSELKEQVEYWKQDSSAKSDEISALRESAASLRSQAQTQTDLIAELKDSKNELQKKIDDMIDEHKADLKTIADDNRRDIEDLKSASASREDRLRLKCKMLTVELDDTRAALVEARAVAEDIAKDARIYERAYKKTNTDDPITREDLDDILGGLSEVSVEDHYTERVNTISARKPGRTLQNTPLLQEFQDNETD